MEPLLLRPWRSEDMDLLRRANTAEMTAHLNGPETEAELRARHERYLRLWEAGEARMFVIVQGDDAFGSIGHWPVRWRDQDALETGWFVLPEAQGRGVGSQALALLIQDARNHASGRRVLTAFPSVHNAASNGLCRRAGFTLVGTMTETFRAAELTVNEWMLDLAATPPD